MPYAAKAIITHKFETDHLDIYVEFDHPMLLSSEPLTEPPVWDIMPPLAKWLLECDDVPIDIVASEWQDKWTLLLTSDEVLALPDKVTLEYDGPNVNLKTSWGKQWEPWGAIVSLEGWPTTFKAGMIILWHGSIVSIPTGWHICDGTEGTPNLTDKFVVGAGNTYAPEETGGANTHQHTTIGHSHEFSLGGGEGIQTGSGYSDAEATESAEVYVNYKSHLPPYYALCYIMKL